MRPYLALIKDSFRAAIASSILYILLAVIAVLLLVLAPLHMNESLDWKLIPMENVRHPEEVARILTQKNDDDNKPVARIWSMLSKDLQSKLSKFSSSETSSEPDAEKTDEENPPKRVKRNQSGDEVIVYQWELIPELNKLIENRDFYREEDWDDISLSDEAKELIKLGPQDLSEERSKRLNRILISRALSPSIDQGDIALEFWYGFWKWDFLTTSFTHQQFAQSLTSQLPYYFDKFVLSIGLFIAILVTANMIPETFSPGSLNLLLSKPVSRWGLYLAKFAGGCVFISLCSGFLFLGIWLWLGLAMDIWDRAILYSIPLYVIVFAIYFSISAFVGLVWRSSIVAIIITLMFWVTCFVVGSVHGVFATKMANNEIINLLPVHENVYSVDVIHQLKNWNENNDEWQITLPASMGEEARIQVGVNSWMVPLRNLPAIPGIENRLAPVFDEHQNRIYAAPFEMGQFMAASTKQMFVSDANNVDFVEVGKFPRDTKRLFATSTGIIAVSDDGRFHRLVEAELNKTLEQAKSKGKTKEKEKPSENSITKRLFGNKNSLFEAAGPNKRVGVRDGNMVAMDPGTENIAVYRSGKLTVFEKNEEGKYKRGLVITPELEFNKRMSCLIEFKNDTILLAFGNGNVMTFDSQSGELKHEYHPESRSAVDSVAGSPDGRFFAIRYRNGNLWVLDTTQADNFKLANFVGQGKVTSFAFSDEGKLWVAENTDRATVYDLDGIVKGKRIAPGGTWVEKIYRMGISPFYKIFPKPGEFYKVVTHLSSSGDTATNADVDLRRYPLENSNPWQPLWSGLGFMAAMLFIACAIFHFRDY